MLVVVAPLPYRQLLVDTGSHALHTVTTALKAPTRAMAEHAGAWVTAVQHQAAEWKQQAWETGDTVGVHAFPHK